MGHKEIDPAPPERDRDWRPSSDRPFTLGEWVVEPAILRLHRDDTEVRLEPKVMRVLVYLAEKRGEVVTRRDLEATIWSRMIVTDDAVTNTVIKLRRALGDHARRPRYIETIAKSGYRLIAEVAPLPPQPGVAAIAKRSDAEVTQDQPPAPAPAESAEPAEPVKGRPAAAAATTGLRRRWPWLLGLLLVTLAVVVGLIGRSSRDSVVPVGPEGKRPVVAVLPFENRSDPERQYFSDGITEDLITELSKLSGLQVVARNSVFAYRGSALPEHRIGRELGARYVVAGGVRRAGERLRINVRLTDATTGRNTWAERYDRRLSDVFAVQEEITKRIAAALQVELAPGELQRLTHDYTASIQAYDQLLRGLDLLGRRSSSDNAEAKAHFERAIELDPRFARAYAGLALAYAQDAVYSHGPRVTGSLVRAEELARKGLAIDDSLPQLHYVVSMVELYRGELASAVAHVSTAIDLRPSYADGYGLLSWILHFAGRPEEGLEAMRRAVALNPRFPAIYRLVKGALAYQQQDYDQAVQLLRDAVEISPHLVLGRVFLAAAYAASGRLDAAAWEVVEIRTLEPGFTLQDLYVGFPIRDPDYRERFLADLRRAGLPE